MVTPLFPSLDLWTITQQIEKRSDTATIKISIVGSMVFWTCRNLFRHCIKPCAKRHKMIDFAYFSASIDTAWSWPSKIMINFVFAKIIEKIFNLACMSHTHTYCEYTCVRVSALLIKKVRYNLHTPYKTRIIQFSSRTRMKKF